MFGMSSTSKLNVLCIILLLFFQVNCSSNTNTRHLSAPYDESDYLLQREELVNELYSLKEPILESVNGKEERKQFILKRVEEIWPKIEKISVTLFEDDPNLADQLLNQEKEMRNFTAHLLFIAKARHCQSPDETFQKSMNKCLPVGSIGSCPENMVLNDGPGNEGFCDCSTKSPPYFVYSNQSGKCFALNSLGPCQNGEWLEINNNIKPECQSAPEGCPVDGQHVYWSNDPEEPKKCWKIGTHEACGIGRSEYLVRNSELRIQCIGRRFSYTHRVPPHSKPPCKLGSYHDQNLKCTPPFLY